eukprot:5692795-Pleurochrysis_carterae.AAC.1
MIHVAFGTPSDVYSKRSYPKRGPLCQVRALKGSYVALKYDPTCLKNDHIKSSIRRNNTHLAVNNPAHLPVVHGWPIGKSELVPPEATSRSHTGTGAGAGPKRTYGAALSRGACGRWRPCASGNSNAWGAECKCSAKAHAMQMQLGKLHAYKC